jgi:eukaryotic-like serine/threonine-protein kinase
MTTTPKRLFTALSTPRPRAQGTASRCWVDDGLDSAFITSTAQRSGFYALVVGAGICAGTAWFLLMPLITGETSPLSGWLLLHCVLMLGLAGIVRRRAKTPESCPRLTIKLAIALQLYACIISASGYMTALHCPTDTVHPVAGIPFTGLLIALFPLLIPGQRRFHTVFALFCAALVPGLYLLHQQLGWCQFGNNGLLEVSMPVAICALMAIVTASITQRIGEDVEQARNRALELGSYRLDRLLGRGGMGEVWLGRHRMLKRPAAIKLIDPERLARSGQDPQLLLDRFEREAQATASLRSRHTVELYDFGRTEAGAFFYAMELLEGIDLDELVFRFGPVPPARLAHLLRQACLSLAEAHAQGLIHRDIKPANIFVCQQALEYDVVKILDFGLVLHTQTNTKQAEDPRLTRDDSVSGTPAYMAPEIALGDRDIDSRADLYALGCLALWLLGAEHVFERETAMKTLMAQISENPPDPASLSPRPLPADLRRLILKLLAKDREQRPATARAVIEELDAIGLHEYWTEYDRRLWWQGHMQATSAVDVVWH